MEQANKNQGDEKGVWFVILAYLLAGLAAMALRLQLASGMGFDFLGVYDAPNSAQFRHWCGISVIGFWSLAASLTLVRLVHFKGKLNLAAWACPVFALITAWLAIVL